LRWFWQEVGAMTQESALTREEIEALDDGSEALGYEPPADSRANDGPGFDALAVQSQQPEDRS
jgi:hypothetical protein